MARTSANRGGNTSRQHSFAVVPSANIQRSVFNRSHGLKTAFDPGYLIPIFCDEALPGDSFKLRTRSVVRMATPLLPMMENIYLDVFYFAIPVRLVWDNFQKFMGEQRNPGDSIDFLVPQFDDVTVVEGSLSDYMGLPLSPSTYDFNSLWHRAYNLVFNEWFRDQNLTNSAVVDTDDGPDTLSDYVLRRRTKRHDYFSSALPFTQKGLAVSLPLGTSANVIPNAVGAFPTFDVGTVTNTPLQNRASVSEAHWNASAGIPVTNAVWNDPNLIADLSTATAATINQIRQAFQIQKLLERDARGGTRYTEIVRAHFRVTSPDARLQRPEYLGGGSTRVNMHPVARTTNSATHGPSALAYLGGFAVAQIDGIGFNKSFTEHTLLLGLANVRADLTYQQGINKQFFRRTRYDFFWPEFAHLGEQAILNKEIYLQGVAGGAADDGTFGYQERYAEYRYKPSFTTGVMRSSHSTPIDQWHLGLEFGSLPLLNNTFIEDVLPWDRVVAVTTEPKFFGDFFFDLKCARPMPTFSVPGMVDHF